MMTKQDICERIAGKFPFTNDTTNFLGALYMRLFGDSLCDAYEVYFDKKKTLAYTRIADRLGHDIDTEGPAIDSAGFLKSVRESGEAFVVCCSDTEWLVVYDTAGCRAVTSVIDDGGYSYKVFTDNITGAMEMLTRHARIKKKNRQRAEFGITGVTSTNEMYTTWYDYKAKKVNVRDNYNDDLPYDRLCSIIKADKPALVLFYGDPGTGKTTLIKHFIGKFPGKNFVFLDSYLLANMQQTKLMSYFMDNEDTTFILEDCEKALVARDREFNPVMPVLLNLTDGVISDVLNIKFLCTFNTSIGNIDPALLRKGRLTLKYEFKKLSPDKAGKLLPGEKITAPMSLADIYNFKEDNGMTRKDDARRKIGF